MFNFFKKQEDIINKNKAEKTEKWNEEILEEDLPFDLPKINNEDSNKNEDGIEKSFDFLTDLSANLDKYLNFSKSVLVIMNENILDIRKTNLEVGRISEQLMQKFNNNINRDINLDDWSKYLDELKNTGDTTSDYVKRMLVQIKDVEEKKREFKRCFFGDLRSYFNNTLILLEEFRNINRFIGQSSDVIKNIENKCQNLKKDFLTMSENLGVHFDNVPLFVNYEPYASNTKMIDEETDPVYENVKELKKDEIKEIFKYGFEEDFSYSREETLVSLC